MDPARMEALGREWDRLGLDRRAFLRLVAGGAGAATIAAILAACGGAAPTAPAPPAAPAATNPPTAPTATTAGAVATTPAAPATSAAAASPTAAPNPTPAAAAGGLPSGGPYSTLEPVGRKGGRVVQISNLDAKTNNPLLRTDAASFARTKVQFNALLGVNPDTGGLFPDLAAEVPTRENGGIAADGLTYTLKLRQGVKWHDGQLFTSKDVVFTWNLLLNKDLGSPFTGELSERIDAVTAPDDYTVVFRMKKVVAPFLVSNLAAYDIVPEHVLRGVPVAEIKSHPFSTGDPKASIGTGPFRFKEAIKDDRGVVVKNPAYFKGEPALDEYIFKVVKDSTVAVSQLKTGEADYGAIAASFYEDMAKQPNLTVAKYDTYSFVFLGFQLDQAKTGLFQQKEVRQALAYAIDREAIARGIYFGLAKVAVGTMPVLSWAYAPDQVTAKYPYDPQRANQLLDEAGWRRGSDGIRARDGKRLSFTMWVVAGIKEHEQAATVIQQQWKAVGVEVAPKTEEFTAWLTRMTERKDFESFIVGFGWGSDPDQSSMWSCGGAKSGFNLNSYCNPKVDELLGRGLTELDQEKRKAAYTEMQNILGEDLPSHVLLFAQATAAVNKRVRNLFPNAINVWWNAHTHWVTDGK